MHLRIRWFFCLSCLTITLGTSGGEVELNGQRFTLPDGLQIDLVATPSLVDRPVSADFDERGRLYVTDSSGTNDHVDIQRKERPHRIMQLRDDDGDGVFDSSTQFADRLMFPEGSLWFDGSLYVAAPPEIWKFTDADDDGVAEQREIWFDGKTLTHCANDLHGPYLGPDGWFYWCKGAFAEQTLERAGRTPITTQAAHIFRRHPSGGPVEWVMTGGMDNPVEVAFTSGGERVFTTTFLVHPSGGNRDGLIHAIYGGVYGKEHDALDGHPRTGELMPVLEHLGVAASCGLTRLESDGLGEGYSDNLLATSFNMHKVTRHVLTKKGATFLSATTDLLASDNLDFHPTDVLEDADGSVIVVDTGGWFRLCCPTSQLEKPDVKGAIYRIRKTDASPSVDPRGLEIDWANTDVTELVRLLSDDRFTVRNHAKQQIGKAGAKAVKPLQQLLCQSSSADHRLQSVWALTQIDDPSARAAVRAALEDADETVRQAALHSISLHRDTLAAQQLTGMIQTGSAHNRRATAEALGRIGSTETVAKLLMATSTATTHDRVWEHSLIYAAIELNDADAIRQFITHEEPTVRRAALIALDQMDGDQLQAADVQNILVSENSLLNDVAWWIAEQHSDWGDAVVGAFQTELQSKPQDLGVLKRLSTRLIRFGASEPVRKLMADSLSASDLGSPFNLALIDAMANSGQSPMPDLWKEPLSKQLSGDSETVGAALAAFSKLAKTPPDEHTIEDLRKIASDASRFGSGIRLQAISLIPPRARALSPEEFQFVCNQLHIDREVSNRSVAVDILKSTSINDEQFKQIASHLPRLGTMELRPVLELFAKSTDTAVGGLLIDSLLNSPSATSLPPDQLSQILSGYGDGIANKTAQLLSRIEQENRSKVQRIDSILALLPTADIRRGIRVFQSSTAACIACHQRGYLGGDVGPDLDGIGKARSERDILESILFPSLTFVRNYEPAAVLTVDGQIYNGVIRESSDRGITLQLDAKKSIQIAADEIEETRFSDVSIMPAGLDKQLTPQQLADLVKYLKEG